MTNCPKCGATNSIGGLCYVRRFWIWERLRFACRQCYYTFYERCRDDPKSGYLQPPRDNPQRLA